MWAGIGWLDWGDWASGRVGCLYSLQTGGREGLEASDVESCEGWGEADGDVKGSINGDESRKK